MGGGNWCVDVSGICAIYLLSFNGNNHDVKYKSSGKYEMDSQRSTPFFYLGDRQLSKGGGVTESSGDLIRNQDIDSLAVRTSPGNHCCKVRNLNRSGIETGSLMVIFTEDVAQSGG